MVFCCLWQVYDGADRSDRLLANLNGRYDAMCITGYVSSCNQMLVVMTTDSSVTHRGFSARYEAADTSNENTL